MHCTVGSTQSRAVICNNAAKSYREVGSKPRQGSQGVSILGSRLWSARPGCRLWEVDTETGAVLATRQYRYSVQCSGFKYFATWNGLLVFLIGWGPVSRDFADPKVIYTECMATSLYLYAWSANLLLNLRNVSQIKIEML